MDLQSAKLVGDNKAELVFSVQIAAGQSLSNVVSNVQGVNYGQPTTSAGTSLTAVLGGKRTREKKTEKQKCRRMNMPISYGVLYELYVIILSYLEETRGAKSSKVYSTSPKALYTIGRMKTGLPVGRISQPEDHIKLFTYKGAVGNEDWSILTLTSIDEVTRTAQVSLDVYNLFGGLFGSMGRTIQRFCHDLSIDKGINWAYQEGMEVEDALYCSNLGSAKVPNLFKAVLTLAPLKGAAGGTRYNQILNSHGSQCTSKTITNIAFAKYMTDAACKYMPLSDAIHGETKFDGMTGAIIAPPSWRTVAREQLEPLQKGGLLRLEYEYIRIYNKVYENGTGKYPANAVKRWTKDSVELIGEEIEYPIELLESARIAMTPAVPKAAAGQKKRLASASPPHTEEHTTPKFPRINMAPSVLHSVTAEYSEEDDDDDDEEED
jgi:hypothetical protein